MEKPFPIVWASIQKFEFTQVRSSFKTERAVGQVLEVGSDLTYLFTKRRHIPEMRKWLDDQQIHSVQVMSFGAGCYIHSTLT